MNRIALVACLAAFFAPLAAGQSIAWRNDWNVSEPPSLFGYFDSQYGVPNGPGVFSSNGDLLLRMPAPGLLDDEIVRIAAAGNVIWRTNLGSYGYAMSEPGYSSMLAWEDGSAIVATQNGISIAKIDALGRVVWSTGVQADQLVRGGSGGLMALTGSTLSAIDSANGQLLWQHAKPAISWYSGGLAAVPGGATYASFLVAGDPGHSKVQVQRYEFGQDPLWSIFLDSGVVVGATANLVYVEQTDASAHPALLALHATDGSPAWTLTNASLAGLVGSPAEPLVRTPTALQRLFEVDGSPRWSQAAASGYNVLVNTVDANHVMANGAMLDAASGAVLWSVPTSTLDDAGNPATFFAYGKMSDGSILGVAHADFYSPALPVLQRYDAATGAALDRLSIPATPQGVLTWDSVADALRVVSAGAHATPNGLEVRVRAVSRSDGHTLWETSDGSLRAIVPVYTGYAAQNGGTVAVLAVNGNDAWLAAYDAATGAKRWDRNYYNSNQYSFVSGRPIVDDVGDVVVSVGDMVTCPGPFGPVYCSRDVVIKLDGISGSELWRRDEGSATLSLFALGSDVLVSGSFVAPYQSATLLKVSGSDGSVAWSSTQADYVQDAHPAPDGNLLVTGFGTWSKIDTSTGALLWSNSTGSCGLGEFRVLPNGDLIAGAALGYLGSGPLHADVCLLPGSAGAIAQNWTLDADPTLRSVALDSALDTHGQLWMRVARSSGAMGMTSLAHFDPASGTLVGEQALYAYNNFDPLTPTLGPILLDAPDSDRLLALTYANAPPAARTTGVALYDTTVAAHGDIVLHASTDHNAVAPGDAITFHVTLAYQGDSAVSGARIVVALPWYTHATGIACAALSASNCATDTSDSVLRATVDLMPGAQVDVSGKFFAVDNYKAGTLRALAQGPVGLREPTLANNFAFSTVVLDHVFANGFE
jgi:outer membrane protein assembly factor BamB